MWLAAMCLQNNSTEECMQLLQGAHVLWLQDKLHHSSPTVHDSWYETIVLI